MNLRIGHGYDVHRLVPGRALILGGVQIDWHLGLDGHSDADVLTHAVMDALLGAAGLGDIGALFPDNDPQYFGIDSTILLRRVGEKIAQAGYQIANICPPWRRPSPGYWPWTGGRSISKRRRRSTWASPAWARA